MRLASVKPGDIVRLGEDYHCFVVKKQPGRLVVRGIGNGAVRAIKANDVTAHWRRSRA